MQVAKSESSQIARDPNEDDPEASDLIGFDAVKETECWRKISSHLKYHCRDAGIPKEIQPGSNWFRDNFIVSLYWQIQEGTIIDPRLR